LYYNLWQEGAVSEKDKAELARLSSWVDRDDKAWLERQVRQGESLSLSALSRLAVRRLRRDVESGRLVLRSRLAVEGGGGGESD